MRGRPPHSLHRFKRLMDVFKGVRRNPAVLIARESSTVDSANLPGQFWRRGIGQVIATVVLQVES